ncbi:Hypothetical predicted protein [Octopus vulgaris]|uniref:Uncharacterized protein n=1 Tax=Octopus vulgaris TaxID=6645 RepID=A0AA36BHW1_OCTVU|nr:Hypothetical predicted protein [Octopus vulgaris]
MHKPFSPSRCLDKVEEEKVFLISRLEEVNFLFLFFDRYYGALIVITCMINNIDIVLVFIIALLVGRGGVDVEDVGVEDIDGVVARDIADTRVGIVRSVGMGVDVRLDGVVWGVVGSVVGMLFGLLMECC